MTENLLKYTYSINNIVGKGTYDSSKRNSAVDSDSITVNNNLIKVDFTYDADKSSSLIAKEYKGNGSATLTSITINYTKKLTIVKGKASYTLTNIKYDIPKALTISPFSPLPNTATNSTLFKVVG